MNLPRFIAQRTTAQHAGRSNAMIHVATAAVAISIAVMVLSLSVMFGFRERISQLVTDTVSDITLCDPSSLRNPKGAPINDNEVLRQLLRSTPNVAAIEPFAMQGGVIRSNSGATGFVLKGVVADANLAPFEQRLKEGTMPRFEEGRRKEVLLPQAIATTLNAGVGDRIELLFVEGDTPTREIFKVCGIYNSLLGDVGANLVLTDIRNVQKINEWEGHQVSGYAIYLDDAEWAMATADGINLQLACNYESDENLSAISAQEAYADIFGWLETHDVNAAVILTIMLIVATFNIVTALLILVLEQTRMIGILKSLGMTSKAIRKIFTYRALHILLYGLLWGNAVAIALALMQKHLHIVKLDEAGYFLNEVPISLDFGWVAGANLLLAMVVMAVVYLSTAIVSHVEIAKSIKYE